MTRQLRTDYTANDRHSAAEVNRVQTVVNNILKSAPQYGIVGADGTILTRKPPVASANTRDEFWAEITSATSIGDNIWEYGIASVEYTKGGQFAPLSSSSSDNVTGTAYNTIESNNTDTGEQGNGVSLPLPAGVTIQAIGIGAIVWVRKAINCDTGDTEYLFQAVNQIDGDCPDPGS